MAAPYEDFPNSPVSYGTPNSFSKSYRDIETSLATDTALPRICLMGTRRSGKSSIQKVVFHKMSPHETLFLESTNEVRVKDINNNFLVQFQIFDFPGNFDFEDHKSVLSPSKVFKSNGALVFVIDAQEDEQYLNTEAIDYFLQLAKAAHKVNPRMTYEVLIHKVDGDSYLSDDQKMDVQREIQQQILEELNIAKIDITPNFHLTSIYDHSIFEAFSKIVQKLLPQTNFLENLLDSLSNSCSIEKAFLFDTISKIYVAGDSTPVDPQVYELCSDMIDLVIDVTCIYDYKDEKEDYEAAASSAAPDTDTASVIHLSNGYTLYLREVDRYLALVCMMRKESMAKSSLVEFNVLGLKRGMNQLRAAKKLHPL